ncbi:MAG: hypothetical protein BGO86_03095 [Chryseobacterium sp. 36-9]|nr:MAG: hypothetical protein BGO86_03095 [Chryseobacterium sp. 36-9]
MPDLGRWFGMDQLAESYSPISPYTYAVNNPAMMIDPDGRDVKPTKNGWEFTGDDINDIYSYLNGGGNVRTLTNALSAWGDMRTGQNFWSYFSSWNGSGHHGGGGSIYTTTVGDGAITGNTQDIQEIIFTKTKIAQVFSDAQIMQNTQASWRTGGGLIMMDSVFDVLGIALANAEPKNKNLAILLGGLAIVATKGKVASRIAASWQGKGAYAGIDAWRDITLAEGKYVVGGLPGQSNFYTTLKGLERSGFSKSALGEGLQIQPHPTFGYRSEVGVYKVTESTSAAFGTTYANPQFGAGGLPQIFIPDYSGLELISTIPLR